MTLRSTLTAIARQLDLDPATFREYFQHVSFGGNDAGTGMWKEGPSWEVDGKLLYALVRMLQPDRILEIGTNHGGSATYMAAALSIESPLGRITTVDINPEAGQHIPDHLRPYVEVVIEDANDFVKRPDVGGYDFIFEDGNHSAYQVHVIYERLSKLLRPGGVIVSHDAAMPGVSEYIEYGIKAGGHDMPPVYLLPPSPCGVTVMRWEP